MNSKLKQGDLIGRGSYGRVYEATYDNTSNLAVKVVPLKHLTECVTELAILLCLRHRSLLCSDHDAVIEDNNIKVIIPRADCDLREYLRNSEVSQQTAWNWARELFDAVSVLRRHRIIHADIKTANVLIQSHRVLLCDFTAAVQKPAHNTRFMHLATTITYRSPEAFLSQVNKASAGWDEAVDLWGLGCVLYEIWTRNTLFANNIRTRNKETKNAIWRSVAALEEFARQTDQEADSRLIELSSMRARAGVDASTAHMARSLVSVENPDFHDMVNRLLQLDPARRRLPRMALLEKHTTDWPDGRYGFRTPTTQPLGARATHLVQNLSLHHGVDIEASMHVLSSIDSIPTMPPRDRAHASVTIAGLVTGNDMKKPRKGQESQMIEALKYVNFRVIRQ